MGREMISLHCVALVVRPGLVALDITKRDWEHETHLLASLLAIDLQSQICNEKQRFGDF